MSIYSTKNTRNTKLESLQARIEKLESEVKKLSAKPKTSKKKKVDNE